ncbi:hypothetical protein Vadar_005987 [Vaccinium darrowii]|uniref:Uncharacterized protein n=1 Tax=Vaccinium darrowii TaxID=229202 RepID=A0ACB7ZHR6_9ERIC|nr:hypothetical protein Vadar_005987 [Vaccinium darrowii]
MESGNGGQHEGEGSGTRDIDRVLAAMARQSEQQAAFMLWQNQQVIAAASGTGLLERFKKLFTAEFEGTVDPADAENWLKSVERVLVAMGVTDEQKVTLATFSLRGEALVWWEAIQRLMTAPLPNVQPSVPQVITWTRFVKAFNDQYFPEAYQFEQEAAFINLKREGMSVPEYEAKFHALSRYAPDLVDTDAKKCRRFRLGLDADVGAGLTSFRERDYADLVDMARKIGKDVERKASEREQYKKSRTETGQGSQASKSGGYYKGESEFQHLKGQSGFKQPSGQGVSRQSMGKESGSSGGAGSYQCFRCGAPGHRVRDCPETKREIRCFNCGEMGHIAAQCTRPRVPTSSSAGSASIGRGTSSVGRDGSTGSFTTPGRVFAMIRQKDHATSEAVEGTFMVLGINVMF